MMDANEQVRFCSLPGDGDPASRYALQDMRAHPRLPARPGKRRADPALQPDAPGSSRRSRRRGIVVGARPGYAAVTRAPQAPAAERREVADVTHDLRSTRRLRGVGRVADHREYRHLHAAHLGSPRRPASPAQDRGGRAARRGVRARGSGADRAGGLAELPGGRGAAADPAETSGVTEEMIARLLAEPLRVRRRRRLQLLPLIPACHGFAAIATFMLALLTAGSPR